MACGNNMVSRAGLQTQPTTLSHLTPHAVRVDAIARHHEAEAARTAVSRIRQAKREVEGATSEAAVRSALKDAETALTAARRTARDRAAKTALRTLEREVEKLRRDANGMESRIAKGQELAQELQRRTEITQAAGSTRDNLSPMSLGVAPHQIAMAGLANAIPYRRHVDRRAQAPHLPREDWDAQRDPLPTHAALPFGQEVREIARTVLNDIVFLNEDGLPVAAKFTLVPEEATPRDGSMQGHMQKILKGTGLDAGHMGPLFAGGVHLTEFTTGQTPAFNRGQQGGFEKAVKAALSQAASIDVSVVVDVAVGAIRARGYWFESIAIAPDGTRSVIAEASGYFSQEPK